MHRWMLLLALAAALLMALAPVVSRGMQAVQGAHASMAHAMPAMAMAGGTQALPPAMDAHAGHAAEVIPHDRRNDTAAGPHDAAHFRYCLAGVRHEMQHEQRQRTIERAILEG